MLRLSGKSIAILLLIISTSVVLLEGLNIFSVGRTERHHRPAKLDEDEFFQLAILTDESHFKDALRHILIPRVVGTPNHKKVREFIVDSLKQLNWDVQIDSFHDTAPKLGKLEFHNIIATLNPNAERYLILAAHYDSKYFENMEFHGATDSAVPCAMLINMAHVLRRDFEQFRNTSLSLMFVFFDGEEAFDKWGPTDSIYGARHLAQHWEDENFIDRIDMLVLLDLIGAPGAKFYSFHNSTEAWYSRLVANEERLSQQGYLQRYMPSGLMGPYDDIKRYFQPDRLSSSLIEDDHVPFMNRNVPILHLIPIPFPVMWHTQYDDITCIDYALTENISLILRLFTMEFLLPTVEESKTCSRDSVDKDCMID